MIGRLLLFDALGMSFRTLKQRKDPDCPICGERATIKALIDYEEFCGIPQVGEQQPKEAVPTVTVEELKRARSMLTRTSSSSTSGSHTSGISRISKAPR